ncbi:MAG: hypothetical protein ACREBN_12425 [Burkholderiaceae bacterium]
MKSHVLFAAAVLPWLTLLAPAAAATFRVDDSATIPLESSANLRWRQLAPSRGGDNTVEGSTTVQVRLNLAPWLRRNGRVFLVLPEQPAGRVAVRWTTQGRLLPGQLVSGQRALVFAGPIASPLVDETLVLKIETDGTRLSSTSRLNFHFEIDVD